MYSVMSCICLTERAPWSSPECKLALFARNLEIITASLLRRLAHVYVLSSHPAIPSHVIVASQSETAGELEMVYGYRYRTERRRKRQGISTQSKVFRSQEANGISKTSQRRQV